MQDLLASQSANPGMAEALPTAIAPARPSTPQQGSDRWPGSRVEPDEGIHDRSSVPSTISGQQLPALAGAITHQERAFQEDAGVKELGSSSQPTPQSSDASLDSQREQERPLSSDGMEWLETAAADPLITDEEQQRGVGRSWSEQLPETAQGSRQGSRSIQWADDERGADVMEPATQRERPEDADNAVEDVHSLIAEGRWHLNEGMLSVEACADWFATIGQMALHVVKFCQCCREGADTGGRLLKRGRRTLTSCIGLLRGCCLTAAQQRHCAGEGSPLGLVTDLLDIVGWLTGMLSSGELGKLADGPWPAQARTPR